MDTTTTDLYDGIEKVYQQVKRTDPLSLYIETPSFLDLVGNLTIEDVVDVGCGDGFYTKHFRQKTSGVVVGIDYSQGMIELANAQKQKDDKEITYLKADCSQPNLLSIVNRQFDLVTPTYLLCHAADEESLENMVQNMFDLCKPGGRVAGLNPNPDYSAENMKNSTKYSMEYIVDDNYFQKNGTQYTLKISSSGTGATVSIQDRWYSGEHYKNTFKKVGFIDFEWKFFTYHGEEADAEYWHDYLQVPAQIMYQAFRPK